jgi:hypothetical protein
MPSTRMGGDDNRRPGRTTTGRQYSPLRSFCILPALPLEFGAPPAYRQREQRCMFEQLSVGPECVIKVKSKSPSRVALRRFKRSCESCCWLNPSSQLP